MKDLADQIFNHAVECQKAEDFIGTIEKMMLELEELGVQVYVKDWSAVGQPHTLLFEFEQLPLPEEAMQKMAAFQQWFKSDPEFYDTVWMNALSLGSLVNSR